MPVSISEWKFSEDHVIPAAPEGLQVIPYVRVSTVKQGEEGLSLEMQVATLERWAKEKGILLGEVVRETRSAETIFGRPALVDLFDQVLRGEVGGILVLNGDRLCRGGSVEEELIVEPFRQAGRIHEVIPTTVEDSAVGRLVKRIVADVRQFERDQIAERTRRTLQWKKESGKAVGHAPYGFNYEPGPRGSVQKDHFVPEWPEHGVWLYIRGMVAGCELTLEGMIERLHRYGVPPPREDGSEWRLNNIHRIVAHVCRVEGWPTKRKARAAALDGPRRSELVMHGENALLRALVEFAARGGG